MKKTLRKFTKTVTLLCLLLLMTANLTACGKDDQIVGSWVAEEGNDILQFNDNGSCSAPFTYNASWIESADSYIIKDDGTLVFSSSGGHANDSFEKTDSEEVALDDGSTYYISGDTLIIDEERYTRTE